MGKLMYGGLFPLKEDEIRGILKKFISEHPKGVIARWSGKYLSGDPYFTHCMTEIRNHARIIKSYDELMTLCDKSNLSESDICCAFNIDEFMLFDIDDEFINNQKNIIHEFYLPH